MTKQDAVQRLKQRLAEATPEQARDVHDILKLALGDLTVGEPLRHVLEDLPVELRQACIRLSGSVLLQYHPETRASEFAPVYAGAPEGVLATLLIEGDWEKIRQMAEELRAVSRGNPLPEPKPVPARTSITESGRE